jgi:hypothetical protein
MPSQVVGKPLVAENDKVRCSATTKENTRCQLAKSVGSHFCLVHVAKVATKAKETATPVRRMVTRSASAAK